MNRQQFLKLLMSSRKVSQSEWWEEFGIEMLYATTDGTAYLDTGYVLQYDNGTTEIAFQNKKSVGYSTSIYGFIERSGDIANRIAMGSTADGVFVGAGNTVYVQIPDEKNKYDITWDRRLQKVIVNNVEKDAFRLKDDGNKYTAFLCSRNDKGKQDADGTWNLVGDVYYLRETLDGIVMLDLIPITVIKKFTDRKGVTHNVGDVIFINRLKRNDVPTHYGKFTGKQLLNGRYPTMEGLTHWWDSENQIGTTWTPKIGNVNISTSDSWENGYFKKLPNNICETNQFNVNWQDGCTVDILYNQLAFPSNGLDSQLWCLNNQSNQEWALHYTASKRSSFYSPTLFNAVPRYGDNLIPLNNFTSDVFTYNGDTEINNYIDNKKTTFTSGNTVSNNKPGAVRFALKRFTGNTNNQTSLVKSIRIYDRPLVQEEIENNNLYDLFVLNEPIYEELESIEATGSQWIDSGVYGDETTELGLEFALTQLVQQKIAGSRTSADSKNITFSYPTNANTNYFNIDFQSNADNRVDTDYPFVLNRYYTAIANPKIMSINGYKQDVKNITPFITPTTLRIGDGYGLSYATNTMRGRIKHYWIKKKNVLVQDCIPVKLLKNVGGGNINEIGMWDKINNKFYKSATSTSFIARPKTGLYEELDYCEADGRQYLLLPFTTSEINYMKITDLSLTSATQGCVVGALNNGNPTRRDYLPYHTEYGNLTLGKPSVWSESINVGINNNVDIEVIQTDVDVVMKIGDESVGIKIPREISNTQYAMFAYYFNGGYVRPLQGKIKELYAEYSDRKIHLKAVKLLENFAGGLSNEIGYLDVENMTFYRSVTGVSFIEGRASYLTYNNDTTFPYTTIGTWDTISKVEYDYSSTDTSNQDVFLGNSYLDGYIGYVGAPDTETMTIREQAQPSTITPNITYNEKGDGVRKTITFEIGSTNTSKVTIGAYSDTRYSKTKKIYGFKVWDKEGNLTIDAEPREYLTGGNFYNKVTDEFLPIVGSPYTYEE